MECCEICFSRDDKDMGVSVIFLDFSSKSITSTQAKVWDRSDLDSSRSAVGS